ncbi:phosphorylase family protein [Chitinilyticum piscinae]|uniref:Purine phosphorylase n=1 Tax=Chitinilyticum piscinae TaxID=2866724 RepID=A0A8J7G0R5_9NEIS|nr:purine phosphorylase [Chitinilyticum piscinae]MBE9609248.1 purine phosphorylase [Chitinilyticum piscinae]
MKITVLFPTATEARFFQRSDVQVQVSGIGMAQTAAATMKLLLTARPDVLILAGIAGVYPGSSFALGDSVLVAREHEADLGFCTRSGFTQLADLQLDMEFSAPREYLCPWLDGSEPLPHGSSNSVNAALAPFIRTAGVDVENMEGAAFFRVCQQEGQRFFELRTISNRVTLDDEPWDMDGSIRNLARALDQLIDWLQSAGPV